MQDSLLRSIGKLKLTIGTITYRNNCALDSKGKLFLKTFTCNSLGKMLLK